MDENLKITATDEKGDFIRNDHKAGKNEETKEQTIGATQDGDIQIKSVTPENTQENTPETIETRNGEVDEITERSALVGNAGAIVTGIREETPYINTGYGMDIDDFVFSNADHVDHNCDVVVNITSADRRKPGRLKVCKGELCEILEPGTELNFYGYLGDKVTVEVVE